MGGLEQDHPRGVELKSRFWGLVLRRSFEESVFGGGMLVLHVSLTLYSRLAAVNGLAFYLLRTLSLPHQHFV